MDDKVFVIIPCFNEEASIIDTLKNLRRHAPSAQLVVVNDGSTDHTSEYLETVKGPNVVVLNEPFNTGIGCTVQTGLLYAERHGAEYAVKFDGDGQHPAEFIEQLLRPLSDGEADLVIASRFIRKNGGYRSTFFRRMGIRIFEILSVLLTGTRITDATSGFRAYNRTALKFASRYYPNFDYPEPEECILFLRNGFRIREIPCMMNSRRGGESSIGSSKAVYFMLKVSFAMVMERLRNRKPEVER